MAGKPGTCVAVRLPNWVGDVVMSLPALQALHQAGYRLACFGRRWAPELLAGCPWETRALPAELLPAVRAVKETGARRGVLLPNSFSSALVFRLGGVRSVGLTGNGRSFLLSRRLRRAPGLHEAEIFLLVAGSALEAWGDSAARPGMADRISLPLTPAARQEAAGALARAGVEQPFVGLCPMATGTVAGRPKSWPRWAEFGLELAHRGCRTVVCPGPGEEERCRDLLPGAACLPGLGLGAYAAVLSRAAAVVANDSGPMHVAAAAGAPTLGVFGVSDPARTRPWGGAFVGTAAGWPTVETVFQALDRLLPDSSRP